MKIVKLTEEHYILIDDTNKEMHTIPTSQAKELIGVVDVEKKVNDILKGFVITKDERKYFEFGYNQALEDNKEKKYTEEDMRKAYYQGHKSGLGSENGLTFEHTIQSLQPQTEWEVEFVDDKLRLKTNKEI